MISTDTYYSWPNKEGIYFLENRYNNYPCQNTIKKSEKIVIKDTKSILKAIKQKEKLRNESLKKFKDRY